MKCPTHDCELTATRTKYGLRHGCPTIDCTVVCWNGSTSTPADAETRALRHKCHELFDPLWKRGPRQIFSNRGAAYAELRKIMHTSKATTHIGMFGADQCRKLIAELQSYGAPVGSES